MFVTATVAFCLILAACSQATRYRVLSFFLDGVPVPEGVEPREPVPMPDQFEANSAFLQGLHKLRAEQKPRQPVPVILSTHKPFAEHKCDECHSQKFNVAEVPHDASLCDKCHLEERERGGWNHGPINLGTCIPCHRPHNSPNGHLLSKPLPDLCLVCHTTLVDEDAEYHRVLNFGDCAACHDPHRMY